MKHIIHDWEDEKCIRLLQNCHRSMQGNGRVICVDSVLPPMGNTAGTPAKLLDILMLIFITGKERTEEAVDQCVSRGWVRDSEHYPHPRQFRDEHCRRGETPEIDLIGQGTDVFPRTSWGSDRQFSAQIRIEVNPSAVASAFLVPNPSNR